MTPPTLTAEMVASIRHMNAPPYFPIDRREIDALLDWISAAVSALRNAQNAISSIQPEHVFDHQAVEALLAGFPDRPEAPDPQWEHEPP